MRITIATVLCLGSFVLLSSACSREIEPPDTGRVAELKAVIKKLEPLHTVKRPPSAGDWLASYPESGQTFDEYLRNRPVTPTGERTIIYVQPLGPFSKPQRDIVKLSAEFLSIYFNRPVKINDDLGLDIIPDKARRRHPEWDVDQILSTYILDEVLKPRLPDDGAAIIAFTAVDLWPGKGWNFVFGQASLRDRVGVWSINRNGDPAHGEDEFRLCLRRTLKTATHETGHMFSIQHCIAYECNMCGSNNREESDRQPVYLCPQCVAKVCWATQADPGERFKKLQAFCEQHQLTGEAKFYARSAETLGDSD